METAVFIVSALIVLAGGLGVVSSRNPVHAALSLIATLFGIAVLFLNLGAELLAVVQVIVYTGAIVVLILFVMMLLGVDREEDLDTEPLVGQRLLAGLVGLLFLGAMLAIIIIGKDAIVTGSRSVTGALSPTVSNITQIGTELFTTYVFALEVTAALLTIAVVGAVVLSRRPRDLQPIPEPESMTDMGDEPLTAIPEEGAH
ncbi:MAG: NADH-quinone oxidoreductase subunit J [Actinobacteria bacterium]|jgi:NADH-quinone oxidoreductase subunit J|nr:NADH-quinone oxidoreductase subunit J [Actinomycetes bacterium]MCX6507122.1 NADH-quinone oxidoreductase subunit J [Actinomycetota bacterium]